MLRAVLLSAGLLATAIAPHDQARQLLDLTPGIVIERSATVRPGVYRFAGSTDLETPALTIRGDNIVVDFNGAVLIGSPDEADPDQFAGVAVLVEGGSKVTIRGATIRGYKVGILARNSPDLRITNNDLSHNWKQRLYSRIDKESLVDWMSYHQNEKDEWLRFGAGIYLSRCDRAGIDHNITVQGQNGLMVTASRGLKIWNNTFQFLSSIGVGLYRVTGSTIMHNRIDWCVRGYSHGFYNRGQDSAGLLMYEQSSNNTVAYNSITHGGDGLFLWAGQSTMDTGEGGANDNYFYRNDFSHAPTNGIEATFSRNAFVYNRVDDCWHGVWGGYSFESLWHGNRFASNAEAIAIEHGQDNWITENAFAHDLTAIRLWENPTQDPNWAYPKKRDTRSRSYAIGYNEFRGNKVALDVRNTSDVKLAHNEFTGVTARTSPETTGLDFKAPPAEIPVARIRGVDPLRAGLDPMLPPGTRRGRQTIIVDEWGPYDWKSPKLWPVLNANPDRPLPYRLDAVPVAGRDALPHRAGPGEPVRFEVLGPQGRWRVVSARGASVSPRAGVVGDVVTVTPDRRRRPIDWEIALEYIGGEVVSPRGTKTPAGQPYVFRYSQFRAPVDWTVRFFEYSDAADPIKRPEAFAKVLAGKPIKSLTTQHIDYLSGRSIEDGVPPDRFAMVAEGIVEIPAGAEYTLQVISDDGVRVWADGKLILDAWEPHGSRVDEVQLGGGRRRVKIEYYERTGWAEMRFDLQPRPR